MSISVKLDKKNKTMTIVLPYHDPPLDVEKPKTLRVATSGGNQQTDQLIDGQPIIVGLNAYIYRTAKV